MAAMPPSQKLRKIVISHKSFWLIFMEFVLLMYLPDTTSH